MSTFNKQVGEDHTITEIITLLPTNITAVQRNMDVKKKTKQSLIQELIT